MGLGKTFTIIALVTTVLTNPVFASSTPRVFQGNAISEALESDQSSIPLTESHVSRRHFHTVMIVVPLVTLQNWVNEFSKWTSPALLVRLNLTYIDASMKNDERLEVLKDWQSDGGVLVIAYSLLRHLTMPPKPKKKDKLASLLNKDPRLSGRMTEMRRLLLDPGADLVIADEADCLSKFKSQLSACFTVMRTKHRIALTGTPLQNNLKEYFCMSNWIKPGHLSDVDSFKHTFTMPINAGDKLGAEKPRVDLMRGRVHVLNKLLKPIVHRKDSSVLIAALKEKRQFVVVVHMTDFQQFLYRTYLAKLKKASRGKRIGLFTVFQELLRLWNHPCCSVAYTLDKQNWAEPSLTDFSEELSDTFSYFRANSEQLLTELLEDTEAIEKTLRRRAGGAGGDVTENEADGLQDDDMWDEDVNTPDGPMFDDDDEDDEGDEKVNRFEFFALDLWRHEHLTKSEEYWSEELSSTDLMHLSNKMVSFLSLLALSVLQGDKMLVFSQSLYALDVIEMFLGTKGWATGLLPATVSAKDIAKKFSSWYRGKQYLRIDGSTADRQALIDKFNAPNSQHKLFMVGTKAGNLGINLYTANRVVIFDSSWNPVHDLQAISRCYRYGQKKEVFVYRLVASGSMEEVIYLRQNIKQALAARVVDAQGPDNQKNSGLELSDTMQQDSVLMKFVESHGKCVSYIADQDVLLIDKEENHLNESERNAVEVEYNAQAIHEERVTARMMNLPNGGVGMDMGGDEDDFEDESEGDDYVDPYAAGGGALGDGALSVGGVGGVGGVEGMDFGASIEYGGWGTAVKTNVKHETVKKEVATDYGGMSVLSDAVSRVTSLAGAAAMARFAVKKEAVLPTVAAPTPTPASAAPVKLEVVVHKDAVSSESDAAPIVSWIAPPAPRTIVDLFDEPISGSHKKPSPVFARSDSLSQFVDLTVSDDVVPLSADVVSNHQTVAME
eukprot:gene28380-35225_t